jgi:hypothetical protein
MLMLTEEERTRIRAEEIFRLEVRGELEASKPRSSRRQRLGSWVNSSFGLWVLSSVVLTGLTTAFTYYQSWRSDRMRKEEIEQRLDIEISNRMSSALARLRIVQHDIGQGTFSPPADIYGDVVFYLDNFFIYNPSNPQDLSIYPEYQKRNFRSLVFELSTVVKPSALPELREALAGYVRLKDLASLPNSSGKTVGGKRESIQAVDDSMEFLEGQMKNRWRSRM